MVADIPAGMPLASPTALEPAKLKVVLAGRDADDHFYGGKRSNFAHPGPSLFERNNRYGYMYEFKVASALRHGSLTTCFLVHKAALSAVPTRLFIFPFSPPPLSLGLSFVAQPAPLRQFQQSTIVEKSILITTHDQPTTQSSRVNKTSLLPKREAHTRID